MVLVPLVGFTATHRGYMDWVFHILYDEGPSHHSRGIFSGALAIAGVQIVILLFIYYAFTETERSEPKKKPTKAE